jgi:hypothetical protein
MVREISNDMSKRYSQGTNLVPQKCKKRNQPWKDERDKK